MRISAVAHNLPLDRTKLGCYGARRVVFKPANRGRFRGGPVPLLHSDL
jgi:hypothetical protein